jgi:hypothetical protein
METFFPPQIIFLVNFLKPYLIPVWQIIVGWGWVVLPFILLSPLLFFWRWWRTDLWLSKQKEILLEIKMPKEILKPVRAMETVLSAMRQTIYAPPDWYEKWIDGQTDLSYAFEIASIGGEAHFFIRCPRDIKDSVEAAIYAQYPGAEISEAEDYTKLVPQDMPNKDWDLWGADYRMLKADPYPIKTHVDFETEREADEEKRIDPVAGLLEAMAKVKPGEQLWIQFIAQPAGPDVPWIKQGQAIRDDLSKRNKKVEKRKALPLEMIDVLVFGKNVGIEKAEEEKPFPPEMKLTTGERDIVAAIEKKISKPAFKVSIRFIFLGRKEVFNKANLRLPFGFFASYLTENLNGLVPWGETLTKIHKSWFFPVNYGILKRRLYLRKRKIFKQYVRRNTPLFPFAGGTFILNIEELASLYHFPSKAMASAPFMARVESKRGEAPPGLPTE